MKIHRGVDPKITPSTKLKPELTKLQTFHPLSVDWLSPEINIHVMGRIFAKEHIPRVLVSTPKGVVNWSC